MKERRKTPKNQKGKTMAEWFENPENHADDYEELMALYRELEEEKEE